MPAGSDGWTSAIRASSAASGTSAPSLRNSSYEITQSSSGAAPLNRTTLRTFGISSRTRQHLGELDVVLDEDQHGVRVVDDVAAVLGQVGLVDADRDRPDRHQRRVGEDPRIAGVGQDADLVALADAERDQALGCLLDLIVELVPGHRLDPAIVEDPAVRELTAVVVDRLLDHFVRVAEVRELDHLSLLRPAGSHCPHLRFARVSVAEVAGSVAVSREGGRSGRGRWMRPASASPSASAPDVHLRPSSCRKRARMRARAGVSPASASPSASEPDVHLRPSSRRKRARMRARAGGKPRFRFPFRFRARCAAVDSRAQRLVPGRRSLRIRFASEILCTSSGPS